MLKEFSNSKTRVVFGFKVKDQSGHHSNFSLKSRENVPFENVFIMVGFVQCDNLMAKL